MFRIILTLLLLFSVSCSKNDIDRADNTPNKGEQNGNNGNNDNDNNTGGNENNPGDDNDKPIEWVMSVAMSLTSALYQRFA